MSRKVIKIAIACFVIILFVTIGYIVSEIKTELTNAVDVDQITEDFMIAYPSEEAE